MEKQLRKTCEEVCLFGVGEGGVGACFVLAWFLTTFLLLTHNKFLRICEQFGKLQSLTKTEGLGLVIFTANKNRLPPSNRQQILQSKPKVTLSDEQNRLLYKLFLNLT